MHEEEDGEPFDYGCCGDNLPLPAFKEDGNALPQKEIKCILKPQDQNSAIQENSTQITKLAESQENQFDA